MSVGARRLIRASKNGDVPRNLTAQSTTQASTYLAWDAPTNPSGTIQGYNVYQDSTLLTASPISSRWFSPADLTPATNYTFKVATVIGGAEKGQATLTQRTLAINATTPSVAFSLLGSCYYPTYLAQNSVLQRDVSRMPLAANSATLTQSLVNIKNQRNFVSFDTNPAYKVPLYIVDSTKPTSCTLQNVAFINGDYNGAYTVVTQYGDFKTYMTMGVPVPLNIQETPGNDASMEIYDVATDTYRGYWNMHIATTGPAAGQWTCQSGGFQLGAFKRDDATAGRAAQLYKYSTGARYTQRGVMASGLLSAPMTVGMEEVKQGQIRHALSMMTPYAQAGYSWPAFRNDGLNNDNPPIYPMQGQWFRLNPSFDIDAQNYNPILKMVCHAVRDYGGCLNT